MPIRTDRSLAETVVRPMGEDDLPTFLDLVDALADYERLPRPDAAARGRLLQDATTDRPRFWALLAEREGRVIGYALYLETYSSFLAQPTLYVEDIFVLEGERGRGAGRLMMRELAREALRRGCGRMEWQVLTWNAPAVAFYERLGARRLDTWWTYRLTAAEVARLAAE